MGTPRDASSVSPVLILGAGINGCALARELVLNGVPVTIADANDIAAGATAKSSRLIHGGLRYLEYADFHLVSESLAERERQLQLAPQFVRPLRLHIPVRKRLGGLCQSVARFLGVTRFALGRSLSTRLLPSPARGLLAVRFGLWLYDRIADSSQLPRHSVRRLQEATFPRLDPEKYRWVCSYSDAQMLYPERFVIALLQDARRHAEHSGVPFTVLPYHKVELDGRRVRITRPVGKDPPATREIVAEFEPAVIVNATGAWGDFTLKTLGIESPRLFGGTRGSHLITRHRPLREAIGEDAVYAETSDGRLVFVLPFGLSTLVGTTDLRFDQPPDEAVATLEEVRYLVEMVNSVFAGLEFSTSDVDAHYCGVRPLPYVPGGRTGAIPRGHSIHVTDHEGIPVYTLIGGKLTTWRTFAEEVADRILRKLSVARTAQTRERLVPGAADYPPDAQQWCHRVSRDTGYAVETVAFLFRLMGTEAREMLTVHTCSSPPLLPGLPIPPSVVHQIIRGEWVTHLEDLVERRLGLIFEAPISRRLLESLADCLVETGRLDAASRQFRIEQCQDSLHRRYGIDVVTRNPSECI